MKNIRLFAAGVCAALAFSACAGAKSATTAQLVADASGFDKQAVTVRGTAKSPQTRQTPRGEVVRYQLCDGSCINVVQFGDASITDGSNVTVSGTFHATFGRREQVNNVLVVGHRGGSRDGS